MRLGVLGGEHEDSPFQHLWILHSNGIVLAGVGSNILHLELVAVSRQWTCHTNVSVFIWKIPSNKKKRWKKRKCRWSIQCHVGVLWNNVTLGTSSSHKTFIFRLIILGALDSPMTLVTRLFWLLNVHFFVLWRLTWFWTNIDKRLRALPFRVARIKQPLLFCVSTCFSIFQACGWL